MNTGSYDTSRLFATESGPDCSTCPKCDCGEYKLNDTWYVEFQYYGTIPSGEAHCAKCTCRNWDNDTVYADCEWPLAAYDVGDKTCDVNTGTADDENWYSCHSDGSLSGLFLMRKYAKKSIIYKTY